MIYSALRFCLYAIGLLLLLVVGVVAFLQTSAGKRLLTSELSRQLSSQGGEIKISGLDGFVPLDMRLDQLQLADQDGVWLKADGAHLNWSPSALLRGRIHVTALRVDRIEVVRPPRREDVQADVSEEPFQLPELPNSLPPITFDRLYASEILLGAPLLGQTASLALDGMIQTNENGDGVITKLAMKRTDEPTASATLDATVGLAPAAMDLKLDIQENGGIVGALAGRPEIDSVDLSLNGSGPLASWSGLLRVDAEGLGKADARLGLALADQPQITLNGSLEPTPSALSNELVALVGKQLAFDIDILQIRAQALNLERLTLHTDHAMLDVAGSIDFDERRLSLNGLFDANELSTYGALADLELDGRGTANIELGGTFDAPIGNLNLVLTQPTLDDKSASSIQTAIALATPSPLSSDRPAFAIDIDGEIKDLLIPGMTLPDPEVRWQAKLTLPVDGSIGIDDAAIETADAKLTARGAIHPQTIEGAIDAVLYAPSLGRFAEPLGQTVEGSGLIRAAIKLADKAKIIDVTLEGDVDDLSGLPEAASALIGHKASVQTDIRLASQQTLTVERLTIEGAHLRLTGAAELDLDDGPLNGHLNAALPDLAVLEGLVPNGINGALDLELDVSGDLDAPKADLRLTTQQLIVAGEPITQFDIVLGGDELIEAPSGNLRIDLTAREIPASLAVSYRLTDDWFHLDGVQLTAPETLVSGDIAIDVDTSLIDGKLEGESADLGEFQAWLEGPLSGSAVIDAAFSPRDGAQDVGITLNSNTVSGDFGSLNTLSIEALLSDIIAEPHVDIQAKIRGFEQGTTTLDTIALNASGNDGAVDFELDLEGRIVEALLLSASGAVRITDGFVIGIETLEGRFANEPIRLSSPLALQQAEDSLWLSGLDLRVGQARLSGDVEIHDSDVLGDIDLVQLPLSWSEVFGGPEMSGDVTAAIDMGGTVSNPTMSARINIDGQLSNAAPSNLPLDLDFTARLDQGRLAAELKGKGLTEKPIYADARFPAQLSLLPFAFELPENGALEGRIDADLELARLADLFELDDQKLAGNLVADIEIGGTLTNPLIRGPMTLEDGSYENGASGTALLGITIDAETSSQRFDLKALTAKTGRQGKIGSTGWLELNAESSFPLAISLNLDQALLVDRDDAEARISGDIAMTGNLNKAEVQGDLKVDRAIIFLPESGGPSLPNIDVTERNGRFVNPPEAEASPETSQPFDPDLDINIAFPN
ncbi:MAG: translocation/assembly module TamB domain-containing protein, partial [Pseudomonadota bacterium]